MVKVSIRARCFYTRAPRGYIWICVYVCVFISVPMTKHYYHLKDEVKKQHVIGRYPANLNQNAIKKCSWASTANNNLFTGKQHQVGPPPPPKKKGGCMVNKDGSKNWNSFLSLQLKKCQKGERTVHLELKWKVFPLCILLGSWNLSTNWQAKITDEKHSRALNCPFTTLIFFQPL